MVQFAMPPFAVSCVPVGGSVSGAVDVYNSATGAWSTAQLSVARVSLAAASVGNVAMFAGGQSSSSALSSRDEVGGLVVMFARVFEQLRVMHYCGSICPVTACVSRVRHCSWCVQDRGCVQ
jgi:hypothetical protein